MNMDFEFWLKLICLHPQPLAICMPGPICRTKALSCHVIHKHFGLGLRMGGAATH